MSKNVTVTGINYFNTGIIPQIISIYKDIFPEKIEEKYVELSNLLFEYSEDAIKLLSSGENINTISKRFTDSDNRKTKRTQNGNILASKIMAMGDKPMTKEALKEIMQQFNDYIELASKEVKENHEKDILEQDYDDNRFSAGNAHNAIESLISQIKVKLQEINSLSIDGMDRIDRIEVLDDRHLSKVDDIFNLYPELKEPLKNLLKSYSNMRVAAFKTMVEQTCEVCDAYKSGEIIDYRKQNDSRVAKHTLIYLALIILSRNFIIKLEQLDMLHTKNNIHLDVIRINNLCLIMDLYTSYFKGEKIDLVEIDQFMRSGQLNLDSEAVITLRNTIANDQNTQENKNWRIK